MIFLRISWNYFQGSSQSSNEMCLWNTERQFSERNNPNSRNLSLFLIISQNNGWFELPSTDASIVCSAITEILWIRILLSLNHNFLDSEGLQGTHMEALNPFNSTLMTLIPRGVLWTFLANLALCVPLGGVHKLNSVTKWKLLMNNCYKTVSGHFFAICTFIFHKAEVQTVIEMLNGPKF